MDKLIGEGFFPILNKSIIMHMFFEGTAKFKPVDFLYDYLFIPMTKTVSKSIKGPSELPLFIAVSV